jgi:hypothetical protein
VLEHDPRVRQQIADATLVERLRLLEDPQHVGVPEPLLDRIRVAVGVDERVMEPVVVGPLQHTALRRQRGQEQEHALGRPAQPVRAVGVVAVIGRPDADLGQDEQHARSDHGAERNGRVREIERKPHEQGHVVADDERPADPVEIGETGADPAEEARALGRGSVRFHSMSLAPSAGGVIRKRQGQRNAPARSGPADFGAFQDFRRLRV